MGLKRGEGSGKIALTILLLIITFAFAWLLLAKGCASKALLPPSSEETALSETLDLENNLKSASLGESELIPLPSSTGVEMSDPLSLVAALAEALKEHSAERAIALIGKDKLTAQQIAFLEEVASKGGIKLTENPVREIGELEVNNLSRWSLSIDKMEEEILLDLKKTETGQWVINEVTLPKKWSALDNSGRSLESAREEDALTVADSFVRALLAQDFQQAKARVNLEGISDARIAGLCIIFEEGKYQLRKKKALRALFLRDSSAGFMVNVLNPENEKTAQFALTLQKEADQKQWQVSEINLDQLLANYITNVAEGDAYYTPIVESPEGGDTLALYFEFNENALTPRAKNQLNIVSNLLQLESSKKMTLSGHADAIGSDEYNNKLSLKRAQSVKEYLISQGVSQGQIQIIAYGESKPRRPNSSDKGRRANRRTEIYLNF